MLVTVSKQVWLACRRKGLSVCSVIQDQSRCTGQVRVGLKFRPPVIETDLDTRDNSEED